MSGGAPTLAFDGDEQILFVGMANLRFESEPQIAAAFEEIARFWKRTCAGKKVYCVVDYTSFALDLALTDTFATYVKQAVDAYAIAVARHTTDLIARATIRAVAIKIHQPSNLYATREEAMNVVRDLQASRLGLGPG
jgi:hypothetical protein